MTVIKRIKANFIEESGKASNQQIQFVLALDGKGKIVPGKEMYGKLVEAVDNAGAMETYFFSAKLSGKEKELIVDYGSALQDEETAEGKKETATRPMGIRWAKLTIVQSLAKDGVLTLQGLEGTRSNFKIVKIEDF